jgi:hypothetical protein
MYDLPPFLPAFAVTLPTIAHTLYGTKALALRTFADDSRLFAQ